MTTTTRTAFFACAALALAACGGGSDGPTDPPGGEPTLNATVSMPGLSFTPFTTTIKRTGTVSFEFPQTPHNVIFAQVAGRPADIQVTSNVTVARTFNTLGLFAYDCTLHPGMKGEVNVVQ
jgi:plastocyanin